MEKFKLNVKDINAQRISLNVDKANANNSESQSAVSSSLLFVAGVGMDDRNVHQKQNNGTQMNTQFMQSLKFMFGIFSNWFMIGCILLLSMIYYQFANYYQYGRITSHFSLAYFEIKSNGNKTYDIAAQASVIGLCCLYVVFNAFILHNLFKIRKLGNNDDEQNCNEILAPIDDDDNDNEDDTELNDYTDNSEKGMSTKRADKWRKL